MKYLLIFLLTVFFIQMQVQSGTKNLDSTQLKQAKNKHLRYLSTNSTNVFE